MIVFYLDKRTDLNATIPCGPDRGHERYLWKGKAVTALGMDMRQLQDAEIDGVGGGIWPLVAIAVGLTAATIAAHNYMLQRGAADHDANCTEH